MQTIFARGEAAIATSVGRFTVTAYTGGLLRLRGWELPVVVDLAGLRPGKSLIANLDHDSTKRVGTIDEVENDGRTLVLSGSLNAATEARREVVESARNGFRWQASVEVNPITVVESRGRVAINGRTFNEPLLIARAGVLKGIAFVSHGADDDTVVRIAASHPRQVPVVAARPLYGNPFHRPNRELTRNGYVETPNVEYR